MWRNYEEQLTPLKQKLEKAGCFGIVLEKIPAKLGEEVLKSSGAFFVESQSLEQMNTRANYQLLTQLAGASGGAFYTASNLNALHVDINNNPTIKPIEKIKTESIALVDLKWMFYLTLVFFAAEWALRRYFGKI